MPKLTPKDKPAGEGTAWLRAQWRIMWSVVCRLFGHLTIWVMYKPQDKFMYLACWRCGTILRTGVAKHLVVFGPDEAEDTPQLPPRQPSKFY